MTRSKKEIPTALRNNFQAAVQKVNELQKEIYCLEGQAAQLAREKKSIEDHLAYMLTATAELLEVPAPGSKLVDNCMYLEYNDNIGR